MGISRWKAHNQINHVLVDSIFKNSVLNVRSFHGANIVSDYLLLEVWIKMKFKNLSKHKLKSVGRLDID